MTNRLTAVKRATRVGYRKIKATNGKSEHAAELRHHLAVSAGLSIAAGLIGILAFRAFRKADRKAVDHLKWQSEDRKLDRALAESLDASDAVARY
ncbi:MAG: hypothetical protein IT203_07445 [Fimbriimonadaceae bacterium]|nr:hypothetical protein [Fimbriimonadaceae bacterium]